MSHSIQKQSDSPTLLVVDDDPAVRKALVTRLRRSGFRVFTAKDGAGALLRFDEHGPCLVILDVMMPGADGFQVCQELKSRNNVPVIFLTGAQHQMIREYLPEMSKAVGGDHYLRKPFDGGTLVELIKEILRPVSSEQIAAQTHTAQAQSD